MSSCPLFSCFNVQKYLVKTQRAGNWKGQEIAKQLKVIAPPLLCIIC